MANVPFDIEGARRAGASDAEINNFLGQKLGFDVAGARQAGASDDVILETLLKGPATKQAAAAPSTGEAGFSAKDTAIALGQSVLGAGKSFTDVAGANNPVSQTLGAAVNKLQEQYTPERKAEMQRRAQLQEEASKSGDIVKEISTFLGGITEAPIQSLAQGLGSVVPYIGTGVVGAVAKLGGPTLTAINTLMGFVQGAGSVKGSLYDNVKQELEKNGMSSREAEAKASKAQEYLGANFLDIAGGAVLGGVGARYGVENLLQKGAAQKLNANLIPRVVTAAAAEAPLEGLQGGQEQLAVNRALQKEGIKVGTLEGVFGSAARDAALGALTAGAVGVRGPGGVSNEQLKKDLLQEELDKQGKVEEKAPIEDTDYRLKSVVDETGAASQFATDELKPNETIDILSTEEEIAKLKKENAERKEKMDAGQDHPRRRAKYDETEAKIKDLETKLGGQNVGTTSTVDETDRSSVGISGQQDTTASTTGTAGTETGGVGGTTLPADLSQEGEGTERTTLDPYKSFFNWASQNGINLPEDGETTDFPELVEQWGAETNQPQDLINELAGVEKTPTVEENKPPTNEVIDEEALAADQAKAAAAAAATTKTRYSAVPYVDPDTKEPTTVNFDEAYVEDGTIYIPGTAGFDYPLENFNLGERNSEAAALEKSLLDKFAEELQVKPPVEETTAEDQAVVEEEVAAELAGEVTPLASQAKPLAVAPEKVLEQKAKTKKATEEAAKDLGKPEQQDYLNTNNYYGANAPKDVNTALVHAGHEIAYDSYDTSARKTGVDPEVKRIANQKNIAQKAKRAQMTKELTGKKDPETGKTYTKKRIESLVSNIPLYDAGVPLSFLTPKELADIYIKHVGTKQIVKEERKSRQEHADRRDKFLETLDPLQTAKVKLVARRALEEEIVARESRKQKTTDADNRKNRADKISKTADELSQEIAEIEKTKVAKQEETAKTAAEKEVSEEKQLTQELKEFNKAAEKILPKKETKPAEKKAPAKSKLITEIEAAVNEDKTVEAVLDAVAEDKRGQLGVIAKQFKNLIKNLGLPTSVTISFGEVTGSDGQFNPADNTITLKGENGVYTGERPLSETVLHEISHYLMDHVVDNPDEYIKSLPPEKRAEARAALNRLNNNYRYVNSKLGNKFNIGTIKEFIAELYSNPRFQEAVANLDQGTLGVDYMTVKEINGKEEVIGTNRNIPGPLKSFTSAVNRFTMIARSIASALGFGGNKIGATFKEAVEDVARLISLPNAELGLVGKEISYSKTAPNALEKQLRQDTELDVDNAQYDPPPEQQPKNLKYFKDLFFTSKGLRDIVRALQNKRYEAKYRQDQMDLAGVLEYTDPKKINNFYTQLTLASGMAKNKFNQFILGPYELLNKSLFDFKKATGFDLKQSLNYLHQVFEALHTEERNMVKFILNVPLDNTKKVYRNNTITAADRRKEIIDLLKQKTLSKDQAKQLRYELDSLIFKRDAKGKIAVDPATGKKIINKTNVDPTVGMTADQIKNATAESLANQIDPDYILYNATGLSISAARDKIQKYEKSPHKDILDDMIGAIKELHQVTVDLNKEGNYWSDKVSNFVDFYGFENYVPLKGVSKPNKTDELFDFDYMAGGKELQDVPHSMDGRSSVSNNPLLQSMSDAVKAAGRAGRRDLTLAVKNASKKGKYNPDGQGHIEAEVIKHLTFEERTPDAIKALPTEHTLFHFNPDGSLDVIQIMDPRLLNSIRSTYKDTWVVTELANKITSGLGQLHTRYNYNFAPLNFVRDALTNAWAIGADMGVGEAARFIKEVSTKVAAQGVLGKAYRVAKLYDSKDHALLKQLAKKDPVIRDMYEFIDRGGMTEYIEGMSLKSNFQRLQSELRRGNVMRNVDQFNKFVDGWTNMFEIASRSVAYGIAKQNYIKKGKMSEEAASIKAAEFAKNLANFEQVGEYGKGMGAIFMFFRPAATGAVRAMEALIPAFPWSLDRAIKNLPKKIAEDKKALDTFKKNYAEKQKNARYMFTTLAAMGSLFYVMSWMMADDDDQGRNKTLVDDMNQWTRFARFHVPGFQQPFQIPWGFGLGAIAAAGAQLTAVGFGRHSFGDAMFNITTNITLDSFIPIPVSRMDVRDNPALWALDSAMPSSIRPILEFVVNKNGLGQQIYGDSNRRMADAFMGGDNIPETYKITAKALFKATDGYIDWSPNSMYFLANSYADGPARIIDSMVSAGYLAAGNKEFSPKTDLPFIGSFVGAKSNIDNKEFSSVERQIKELSEKLNGIKKADPESYPDFLDKNPMAEAIVAIYDRNMPALNTAREEAKRIRLSDFSPKEKTELLKDLTLQQNLIKRNMVDIFKDFDIEP